MENNINIFEGEYLINTNKGICVLKYKLSTLNEIINKVNNYDNLNILKNYYYEINLKKNSKNIKTGTCNFNYIKYLIKSKNTHN